MNNMSKKMPLLISTLSLCLSSLASVAAWAEEVPRTAWTYEEMAAMNVEFEAELDEACADDDMCRDSYIYSKKEMQICVIYLVVKVLI